MNFCGTCGNKLNSDGLCSNCNKEKKSFCGLCGKVIIGDKCTYIIHKTYPKKLFKSNQLENS